MKSHASRLVKATAEVSINPDDLSDGNVVRLLQAHRIEMLKHSPPESVHALDTSQLKAADIRFWSAWVSDQSSVAKFAGCGALKDLGGGHGELKSMKTELSQLRKGVAQTLLSHIITQAKSEGFVRLSLETGTQDVFLPAHRLYEKYGFQVCPPFANYTVDPLSVCMTLLLSND